MTAASDESCNWTALISGFPKRWMLDLRAVHLCPAPDNIAYNAGERHSRFHLWREADAPARLNAVCCLGCARSSRRVWRPSVTYLTVFSDDKRWRVGCELALMR